MSVAPKKKEAARNCSSASIAVEKQKHATMPPPKVILERPLPNNLRVVPSCNACNLGWSKDEEYVAVALAHMGTVPNLQAKIEIGGTIDRALINSAGLDQNLISSLRVDDQGRVTFTPDYQRIARIAEKMASGLFILRYGLGVKLNQFSTYGIFHKDEQIPLQLSSALWGRPGNRRKRWIIVQNEVFHFLISKSWLGDTPSAYCLMQLHSEFLFAVSCPPPVGRKIDRRLEMRSW